MASFAVSFGCSAITSAGATNGAANGDVSSFPVQPLVIGRSSGVQLVRCQTPKPADSSTPATKSNSILCADCEGNGAKACTQCNGSGVNAVDYFNGQFKAGAQCWLCSGKRDILCGNCNGAGFIGGFMSTFDE